MSRLLLLRHARAAWAEPGMRDFDRPLNAAGRQEADAIGATMLDAGYLPDRVICSNAKRARETWDAVARYLRATSDVIFTDKLYITDAAGYANVVAKNAEIDTLLLVGHNPMIEDVCFAMAPGGDEAAVAARSSGFPASGLAVLAFPGSLADAAPSRGRLDAFVTPADQ